MNPYLLFLLLDLPVLNGPVAPSEFPSGYRMGGEDSAASVKEYVWIGTDTLIVRSGNPPIPLHRLDLLNGCPVRETRIEIPSAPEHLMNMTCSGGRVSAWISANQRDSGAYLYHAGFLDSMVRFGKYSSNEPFKIRQTMKATYDANGRPLIRRNRFFEDGSGTATDSLVNTYAYHLPDSIVMRTAADEAGETRVTVFRLKDLKIVTMTETVTQADKTYVYNHYWSHGETAALRRPGSRRAAKAGRAGTTVPGRFHGNGEWWRPDGRSAPAAGP